MHAFGLWWRRLICSANNNCCLCRQIELVHQLFFYLLFRFRIIINYLLLCGGILCFVLWFRLLSLFVIAYKFWFLRFHFPRAAHYNVMLSNDLCNQYAILKYRFRSYFSKHILLGNAVESILSILVKTGSIVNRKDDSTNQKTLDSSDPMKS